MRKFLLTVLVVAGLCLLARPAVDSYWIRSYGGHLNDDAVSVQATSDGGAIAAGVGEYIILSPIGHYNGKIWLLKTKPAGALQWRRDFELGGEHDEVGSVRQTSDGGYVVAGSTMIKLSGTLRYDTDPFLLRTTAAGPPKSCYAFGGMWRDLWQAAKETSDGDLVAGGEVAWKEGGVPSIMAAKIGPSGAVRWCKAFVGEHYSSLWDILQTSDGGYLCVGFTWSYGAGETDGWLIRLNAKGGLVWQKTYGGAGSDTLRSAVETPDGGFVAAGGLEVSDERKTDAWVLRLDGKGNILWQTAIGGDEYDGAQGVVRIGDDGFVFSGSSSSLVSSGTVELPKAILVKLDQNGKLVWQKRFGRSNGSESLRAADLTARGSLLCAGYTNVGSAYYHDMLLIKASPSGGTTAACAGGSDPFAADASLTVIEANGKAGSSRATAKNVPLKPRLVTVKQVKPKTFHAGDPCVNGSSADCGCR